MRIAVFLLIMLTTVAPNAQAVEYRCIDLGTDSRADSINNSGQIAGMANGYATVWQNGGSSPTSLGCLPGGTYSYATCISDSGVVVGDSGVGYGVYHAFAWDGQMNDLGTLGGDASIAYGVNTNGKIVGWAYPSTGGHLATEWADSASPPVPLAGAPGARAYSINTAGTIVGAAPNALGRYEACYWGPTGLAILDSGHRTGYATDISDAGQIVGYFDSLDSTQMHTEEHVFSWIDGEFNDLGRPLPYGSNWAMSVNSQGWIAGMCQDGSSNMRAWVVIDGATIELPLLTGFSYSQALSINDSGQVVGWAIDSSGASHALLWQPVPEPSSMIALISGLSVVALVLRRRR